MKYHILFLFSACSFLCLSLVSCNSNNEQKDEKKDKYDLKDNNGECLELYEKDVNDSLKRYTYPSPILIDTGAFWNEEESYEDRSYHVNAYSKLDTASIEHYKSWSDSILNVLGGGKRSMMFFFNDKESTPKIPVTMWFNDENYEKHCFLLIKYKIDNVEYQWNPF